MNADGSKLTRLTFAASGERSSGADSSPDSSKIVFNAVRSATGSDREIYVINADGSLQTRVTTQAGNDVLVPQSPDSVKFAFGSDCDGITQIYTMNPDGSNQVKLTSAGLNTAPSWNPRRDATVPRAVLYDFDGDGKADVAVFRDGNWYLLSLAARFRRGAVRRDGRSTPAAFVP